MERADTFRLGQAVIFAAVDQELWSRPFADKIRRAEPDKAWEIRVEIYDG